MPALLAVALAAVACVISLRALRIARQSQQPRQPTEQARAATSPTSERSAPPLIIDVYEGQARRQLADDGRDYALLLTFKNDGEAPVTVSSCVLRVTYRTRANFLGAVDLEPRLDVEYSGHDTRPVFHSSLLVKPHQHPQRWLLFHTVNVIPRHCRVQEYAIVATTEDGRRHFVDASLPSLFAADTDGQGPATWGWD